uniref:L-serine ammonia-lyase n=1 Tax=Phallusia mammillata TaxID=59560 RepID=A0A6F9DU92_9ASCI|nr:serine racemase-like [Phallusia mammillata]
MTVPHTSELCKSINEAHARILPHINRTPLEHSLILSNQTECNVHLKLECEQVTGSFKARGAFNKLGICSNNAKSKQNYVTASSGNHAMACALALSKLKQKGTVYVPNYISEAKESYLKLYDIEVKKYGDDCLDTEKQARKMAEANDAVYISPYADLEIVYGQGTVGKEIVEDLPNVDAIFVSVGGGGLISGIGAYAKHQNSSIEIVGCSPSNSAVMQECVKAGEIIFIESLDTLSDGTAGGVEEGSITLPLCQKFVDKWVQVSEEEIAKAVYMILEKHHKMVEGSAGVAVAGFLKCKKDYIGKNVAIVICGANISMEKLKFVIGSVETENKSTASTNKH